MQAYRNDPWIIVLISFAVGLAAGCFGGLIGVGGGIIMIPLMVSLFKLSQHRAHGTSLLALVFTGAGGVLIYGLHREINYPAAATLAVSAMLTAAAGARFAGALPGWKLRKAFGFFLILCALFLTAKRFLPGIGGSYPLWVLIIILIFTGLLTGFISGMMGVGGAVLMIPVMILFAGFGQHTAQGTALAVMIPVGLTGAVTHYRLGHVARRYLPGLIVGILLGAVLGGVMANRIADEPLRLIFIAAMVIMGIRYARTARPADAGGK